MGAGRNRRLGNCLRRHYHGGGNTPNGGGVYVATGCQLTMTGGNIVGCLATYEGGGVYIDGLRGSSDQTVFHNDWRQHHRMSGKRHRRWRWCECYKRYIHHEGRQHHCMYRHRARLQYHRLRRWCTSSGTEAASPCPPVRSGTAGASAMTAAACMLELWINLPWKAETITASVRRYHVVCFWRRGGGVYNFGYVHDDRRHH